MATTFRRIADELAARIAAGELRAGDRVPSTRQIAGEWGVALATSTKALTTNLPSRCITSPLSPDKNGR